MLTVQLNGDSLHLGCNVIETSVSIVFMEEILCESYKQKTNYKSHMSIFLQSVVPVGQCLVITLRELYTAY
jgi:hypothetical protein